MSLRCGWPQEGDGDPLRCGKPGSVAYVVTVYPLPLHSIPGRHQTKVCLALCPEHDPLRQHAQRQPTAAADEPPGEP